MNATRVVTGVTLMLKGAAARDVVMPQSEAAGNPKAAPRRRAGAVLRSHGPGRKCVGTSRNALRDGAIFVLIVLIVLLARPQAAIHVSVVLPRLALTAFIMLSWVGLSANLMSLGDCHRSA